MADSRQSRRATMARSLALVVVAACLSAALVAPAVGASPARQGQLRGHTSVPATSASCTTGVRVATFKFSPSTVVEGARANLEIAIENCTAHAFSGSLETFGLLVCEAVDPLVQSVSLPAHTSEATIQKYTAPDCAGKGHITGRLMKGSTVLQTRTAVLRVVAPPPS